MKGARGGLASVRPPNGRCQVVSINGGRGVGAWFRRFSGEGATLTLTTFWASVAEEAAESLSLALHPPSAKVPISDHFS